MNRERVPDARLTSLADGKKGMSIQEQQSIIAELQASRTVVAHMVRILRESV